MMALDRDTLLLKRMLREASERTRERSDACYVAGVPLLVKSMVIEAPRESYPLFLLPCMEAEVA